MKMVFHACFYLAMLSKCIGVCNVTSYVSPTMSSLRMCAKRLLHRSDAQAAGASPLPKRWVQNTRLSHPRVLWQSDQHKKYRLTKWGILCTPIITDVWGIWELDVKINASLENGFKLLRRMVFWHCCFVTNIYVINPSSIALSQEILTFRKV
jgi:hypothetical protein